MRTDLVQPCCCQTAQPATRRHQETQHMHRAPRLVAHPGGNSWPAKGAAAATGVQRQSTRTPSRPPGTDNMNFMASRDERLGLRGHKMARRVPRSGGVRRRDDRDARHALLVRPVRALICTGSHSGVRTDGRTAGFAPTVRAHLRVRFGRCGRACGDDALPQTASSAS